MLGNPLNLFMMSDNDVEISGLIAKKYAQRCGHKYGHHIYMIQIVRRHLTSKPDLEASVELLAITYSLSRISEQEFREALTCWYEKWRGFLSEKSVGVDGRMHFTHPRPRAAYRSLKFYLPYLWTFEHYPELCIPNTNAAIESLNQRLKTLLRNHRGISSQRRMKLLEEYIARYY